MNEQENMTNIFHHPFLHFPIHIPNATGDSNVNNNMSSSRLKRTKRKSKSKQIWPKILAESKLFIQCRPWDLTQPDVCILFADENFAENFKYPKEMFGINENFLLKRILGKATNPNTLNKIYESLHTGTPYYQYICLYGSDKIPLACHVTVTPITGSNHSDCPLELTDQVTSELTHLSLRANPYSTNSNTEERQQSLHVSTHHRPNSNNNSTAKRSMNDHDFPIERNVYSSEDYQENAEMASLVGQNSIVLTTVDSQKAEKNDENENDENENDENDNDENENENHKIDEDAFSADFLESWCDIMSDSQNHSSESTEVEPNESDLTRKEMESIFGKEFMESNKIVMSSDRSTVGITLYAVITIRSASVVGNTERFNPGLLQTRSTI